MTHHRPSPSGWHQYTVLLLRHKTRFLTFAAIGGGIFLLGLALQVILVSGIGMVPVQAYIVQGVLTIQLSLVLNRFLTWRDRDVSFLQAFWRWNTQKAVTAALNFAAYDALIKMGLQYIAATVLLVAIFTPVNYVLGNIWSFLARRVRPATAPLVKESAT